MSDDVEGALVDEFVWETEEGHHDGNGKEEVERLCPRI